MYSDNQRPTFCVLCMMMGMFIFYTQCDVTSGTNSTEWNNGFDVHESDNRTTPNISLPETDFPEICVNCTVKSVDDTENKTDVTVSSFSDVSNSTVTSLNDVTDADNSFNTSSESRSFIDNTTFALDWTNETTTTTVKSHPATSVFKTKGNKSSHSRRRKPHLTKEQYEYLVRHFTGFMPNVKVGKPKNDNGEDDDIELDDGPFGSILWRDKKYLVSVLIPIGVGITGAMLIIVMAYATRVCRRRKVAERNPRTLLQPSVSRPDDIMLLDQSSDDEF